MTNIAFETYPSNPHCLSVHTRTKLSEDTIIELRAEVFQENLKRSGKDGEQRLAMVRELLAIDGIENATISRYELTLHKARMFTWSEMEQTIIDILRKYGLE